MNILFASSEVAPYASTGGLGEVSYALPLALKESGHEVVRVMPMYRQVLDGNFHARDTGLRLRIPVGFRVFQAEIWISEDGGVPTYFVRRDEYFDRRAMYALPERDYTDNLERFIFFQKAVVALVDQAALKPDIVHANDWMTALIPMYLRHGLGGTGRPHRERTVFTIHNMAYQGVYPGSEFPLTNLPFSCFSIQGMEFFGNINCMKAGLTSSDRVTTVSPGYAAEICGKEQGCGLDGVMRSLGSRLMGISNGVDYQIWNPQTDPDIECVFSAEDLSGKKQCREELLRLAGWKEEAGTEPGPVFGMVVRLVQQKGIDLLDSILPQLADSSARLFILGSGVPEMEAVCRAWAVKWPDRVHVVFGYDRRLAHKIQAGSDFFLMPSRFEPGGLSQLYAMRYGTIPVVHATGGLKDTVHPFDATRSSGNGILFEEYKSEALAAAIRDAMELYADPELVAAIRKRIMAEDHSWPHAAEAYVRVYQSVLNAPR